MGDLTAEIFRANDSREAEKIQKALKDAGLSCEIERSPANQTEVFSVIPIRILVAEENRQKAQAIIIRTLNQKETGV